jgi:hypothetical protein
VNTLTRRILSSATAMTALVVLGTTAHLSPEFKQHATTTAIVLLALISISGLLAGLVLRRLDTDSDIRRPERPPGARTATAGTAHTGGIR